MTRLYRNRTDKMLGGVCGGLGQYLGIDPTWVRLFFVLLALGDGVGILMYGLLWIILPTDPDEAHIEVEGDLRTRLEADVRAAVNTPHPQAQIIAGVALIVLGAFWFIGNLNVSWLWWLDLDVLWPVLLIIGGAVMLLRARKGE